MGSSLQRESEEASMKSPIKKFYKVVSKTKNPLDGFTVKSYRSRNNPEGYFPTEEAAHYDWLVKVWRPCFNPVKVEKQLYRLAFDGGGYFFKNQMRDFDKFKTDMESIGFSIVLDEERADEEMYRVKGQPLVSMTLEDAFNLHEIFGEAYLDVWNGQKVINIGRI
jgi:hypothetical protein